ncbi:MAG TPA: MarR family transcriptional regulator [Polyangiaceae bacterium]|nr:MarR family transcriptional regulator [Polyangiaceae bacterium]
MLSRFLVHRIFFGLKRAHHGTLHITRRVLAALGLTAARFDLLYAVRKGRRGIIQSALRKVLGVSRATVSRMLGSLEELGLVRRTPHEEDRRQKLVELTTKGWWRISRAHRHFTRSGWAQLAIDSALASEHAAFHWCDENACLTATASLHVMLGRIRRGFRDFATLDYPSEGEEIITWFDYYDSDDLDMWPETIAGLDRERT